MGGPENQPGLFVDASNVGGGMMSNSLVVVGASFCAVSTGMVSYPLTLVWD